MSNIIYLDGLFYKSTGIGRYYESLIKGLLESKFEVYTTVSKSKRNDFINEFGHQENLKCNFVDYRYFSISEFLKQGKILKDLEGQKDIVFHYPHINLSLYTPENLIVTIHDLRPLTEFWDRSYLKKKIFERYFKRAIKKAKRIITISESMKEELINFCPDCSSKIKAIYNFTDEKFLHRSKECPEKRIIRNDYLLYIGTRKKHKNLSRLIVAFSFIKKSFPNLKLVIAGKKDKAKDEINLLREKLDLKGEIIEVISPSDEEIINLYKYAKAFVFPSLYEGFGLPPLEAMAIGTPVVDSNIPVIKEICGDGAYFFNPYDTKDMAKAIYRVLTDNNLRRHLIEKGKERIKFFDSENAVSQYIKVYKEVLSGK